MKKRLSLLLLTVATMVMLAGCGSGDPEPAADVDVGTEISQEYTEEASVSGETLEEYINSDDTVREEIESMVAGTNMTIDINGNTMTYVYAYPDTYDAATIDAMAAESEKVMGTMSSTFESLAETLESETGIDDITLEVIYEDGAGTEIYKATY